MYLTLLYLELDTFKQILPTYAPAAHNSMKLGCLTSLLLFEFPGRHSGDLSPSS